MAGLPERFLDEDLARLLAERLCEGRRLRARRGKFAGGAVPYGYRRRRDPESGDVGLIPEAERGPWVRRIFLGYLELKSLGRVASWLDRQGVPSPRRGGGWTRASLRALLRNEAYLGTLRYGGIRTPAAHTPLVDEDLFRQVQRLLAKNRRGGTKP